MRYPEVLLNVAADKTMKKAQKKMHNLIVTNSRRK